MQRDLAPAVAIAQLPHGVVDDGRQILHRLLRQVHAVIHPPDQQRCIHQLAKRADHLADRLLLVLQDLVGGGLSAPVDPVGGGIYHRQRSAKLVRDHRREIPPVRDHGTLAIQVSFQPYRLTPETLGVDPRAPVGEDAPAQVDRQHHSQPQRIGHLCHRGPVARQPRRKPLPFPDHRLVGSPVERPAEFGHFTAQRQFLRAGQRPERRVQLHRAARGLQHPLLHLQPLEEAQLRPLGQHVDARAEQVVLLTNTVLVAWVFGQHGAQLQRLGLGLADHPDHVRGVVQAHGLFHRPQAQKTKDHQSEADKQQEQRQDRTPKGTALHCSSRRANCQIQR